MVWPGDCVDCCSTRHRLSRGLAEHTTDWPASRRCQRPQAPRPKLDRARCNRVTGDGVTAEYLAKTPTRLQAAITSLRLQGLEDEALAFEGMMSFTDADEVLWAGGVAILAYLKGNPEAGWAGYPDGSFKPNAPISSQEYVKVLLEALGYVQGVDFEWVDVFTFAATVGLDDLSADTVMTNEHLAVGSVEALAATTAAGTVLVEDLVAAGAIALADAQAAGLVPMVTDVAVVSAKALNSTMVEVMLDDEDDMEAPASVDASIFTVMAGTTALEVTSAVFAPWDTDMYTVLLTVDAMTAGTLYTVESGDASANFGGRDVDEDEPTVSSVTSTDYNEVTIVFNEAVMVDGLTVVLAEKYGDKDELAVVDWAYDGSDTIVITTAEQAGATLYTSDIDGAADLAGNVMDEDDTMTFVGKDLPTDDQTVTGAEAEDYNQVVVNFSQKVAAADVLAANFTITEKYGTKAEIAVLEAVLVTDADDTDVTSDSDDMAVLLTVASLVYFGLQKFVLLKVQKNG